MKNNFAIPAPSLIANRAARNFGSNRATKIKLVSVPTKPLKKELGKVSMRCLPRVVEFDGYHAESRTGIKAPARMASMWPKTYTYIPTVCIVAIPDLDAIYSNDNH